MPVLSGICGDCVVSCTVGAVCRETHLLQAKPPFQAGWDGSLFPAPENPVSRTRAVTLKKSALKG